MWAREDEELRLTLEKRSEVTDVASGTIVRYPTKVNIFHRKFILNVLVFACTSSRPPTEAGFRQMGYTTRIEPMATDTNETGASRKGYVLVTEEIADRERFLNGYIPPAVETIEDHGGRVLVGAPSPRVLEGEWEHNFTVVLEFPSVEDAQQWYNDTAYEEVRPIRHEACTYGNMVIAPEFAPEDLEGK